MGDGCYLRATPSFFLPFPVHLLPCNRLNPQTRINYHKDCNEGRNESGGECLCLAGKRLNNKAKTNVDGDVALYRQLALFMIIPVYGKGPVGRPVLYTDTAIWAHGSALWPCEHPLDIVLMQTDRGKCAVIACPVGGHWLRVKQSFIKQAERIIKTHQTCKLTAAQGWNTAGDVAAVITMRQTGSPLGTHGNLLVKTNSGMVLVWLTSEAFLLRANKPTSWI